jgi:Xaa-Pro aminopeptidase
LAGSFWSGFLDRIRTLIHLECLRLVTHSEWRDIYAVVLAANRACLAAIKPGINWEDIHRLADRVQVEGLKKLGILKGDVEEMLKKSVGGVFMPHGLGHLLGLVCSASFVRRIVG